MKTEKLPQTDSTRELARFWDTHDLMDYEGQLQEVVEPVFERAATVEIHLEPQEAETLQKPAASKGQTTGALIRRWLRERIGRSAPLKWQPRPRHTPTTGSRRLRPSADGSVCSRA